MDGGLVSESLNALLIKRVGVFSSMADFFTDFLAWLAGKVFTHSNAF
jgi:hypothetical protein